jgi:hypothetical protein
MTRAGRWGFTLYIPLQDFQLQFEKIVGDLRIETVYLDILNLEVVQEIQVIWWLVLAG